MPYTKDEWMAECKRITDGVNRMLFKHFRREAQRAIVRKHAARLHQKEVEAAYRATNKKFKGALRDLSD